MPMSSEARAAEPASGMTLPENARRKSPKLLHENIAEPMPNVSRKALEAHPPDLTSDADDEFDIII